ncbi:unnamed protein product [Urochloa humidicola]
MALLFSKGSFAAVTSQVLWLAAFFAGLAVCAVGIPYPQQHSAFALPSACAAGITTFNKLYLFCFAAISSCIIQASCVTLIISIMGSRKRLDRLSQPSAVWCRLLLLVGLVFCGISFSCVIGVVDLFIFVRISRFGCLSLGAKVLVIAGDLVAAMWGIAIFTAGSYIALFCN